MTGEGKRAISGLLLSNENYKVAVALLKERFGGIQSVINSHYVELVNLPMAFNSPKGLRLLYDQIDSTYEA